MMILEKTKFVIQWIQTKPQDHEFNQQHDDDVI